MPSVSKSSTELYCCTLSLDKDFKQFLVTSHEAYSFDGYFSSMFSIKEKQTTSQDIDGIEGVYNENVEIQNVH